MKELSEITKVIPRAKDDEAVVALAEAFDDAKNLQVMASSEAGQTLSRELWSKCMSILDNIRVSYKTMPEHELRASCAAVDVQMSLYEELTTSGFMQDVVQKELDEAVKALG